MLIILMVLFVIIGIVLSLIDRVSSFGLNFLTEMIGAGITILIFESLLKKNDDQKMLPKRISMYEDIALFNNRLLSFWLNLFRDSVEVDDPEKIEMFYSKEYMGKIWENLWMNSFPRITPKTDCWSYFINEVNTFKETGNKILDRYSNNIDPEIYRTIYLIINSEYFRFTSFIPGIRYSDKEMKFPRVSVLGNYLITPEDDDYENILKLYSWCKKEKDILQKKSKKELFPVSEYMQMNKANHITICKIPEDVLKAETLALIEFKRKLKNLTNASTL